MVETQHPRTAEHEADELSQEELDSLYAEPLPEREAMSVLRMGFLSGAPVEAEDAELPDAPDA